MGSMTQISRDLRELAWNRFLASLLAAELHWLCQHDRELLMHDQYVDGLCTIEDVHTRIQVCLGLLVPEPAPLRVD